MSCQYDDIFCQSVVSDNHALPMHCRDGGHDAVPVSRGLSILKQYRGIAGEAAMKLPNDSYLQVHIRQLYDLNF